MRELVSQHVQLHPRKEGWQEVMFSGACDRFGVSYVPQVLAKEKIEGDFSVEVLREPLGLVTRVFKWSVLRWSMVDKEAFVF